MILAEAGEAHVFVADLARPMLSPEDRHHLERVLRLRHGAPVTVSDGAGRWRVVAFGSMLEPRSDVVEETALEPAIAIGFALVKGDRPELVVQKLTELGVDVITPFVSARSVVRWDEPRAARHHERLRRVAREAAMQCRRSRLPIIEPPSTFAALIDRPGACLATLCGQRPELAHPRVLIGPEGGWAPDELGAPVPHVGLAPYVLRSETAAIAAGALLVALRSVLR